MKFNPNTDKIAITIPKFSLLKHSDSPFQKYNEPYIVSVALDALGNATPEIDFNLMSFPNVTEGGTVTMLGDGHIVYGPRNPGDFVAVSILVMEKDQDVRDLGEQIEAVVQSKATDLGIKAIVATNPGSAVVLALLKELTGLVASFLKKNKDDELFRVHGTYLKGKAVPYDINRSVTYKNDYVSLDLSVIPLREHNEQGPAPRAIFLESETEKLLKVPREAVPAK